MSGDYVGGSIMVLDCIALDTTCVIWVESAVGSTDQEKFSINIDNLVISNVGFTVGDFQTSTILAGGSGIIDSWTLTRVYDAVHPSSTF